MLHLLLTLPIVLQSLLPNLMAILQRGKDNAAIFQVLEGYLVTADLQLVTAMLNTHMPQIAASLLGCLNAVLQVAQKAQTGMQWSFPASSNSPLPSLDWPCPALFCPALLCAALPQIPHCVAQLKH